MSEEDSLTEGQVLPFIKRRDYQFKRTLGGGSCGKTVLLHDDVIDEYFVCKKYQPNSPSSKAMHFASFQREMKLLYKVHHPNIVRFFNAFLYPEEMAGFILMEYVEGMHIDDYIKSNPSKINDVFVQALSAFEHLQGLEIMHRDIRPENVMVTVGGVVKVIDLGFGKQFQNFRDRDNSVQLAWRYDTPDEFEDSRYEPITDVYFFGKLFEELIRENQIEDFAYTDVLNSMIPKASGGRTESFAAALQVVRSTEYEGPIFSFEERAIFQAFIRPLVSSITKIKAGAKYEEELEGVKRALQDVNDRSALCAYVPDLRSVIRCFVSGAYYFRSNYLMPTDVLKDFCQMLKRSSTERGQIILANVLHSLDALPRYTVYADEIPF